MAISQRFKQKYTTFVHYSMNEYEGELERQKNIEMTNQNILIIDKNMNRGSYNQQKQKNNQLSSDTLNKTN